MKKTKTDIMMETATLLVDDVAIIDIYEKVLNRELYRFPPYTWELPNSLYYAQVLTRYLFEKKLNWDIDDIKNKFNLTGIIKYKMNGMFTTLFHSIFDLIDNAYPNQIHPWELKGTPKYFWDSEENRKQALLWFFHVKLQWTLKEVDEKLTVITFRNNDLSGLISYFNNSPYSACKFLYPNYSFDNLYKKSKLFESAV